jgi:hypothetical protein
MRRRKPATEWLVMVRGVLGAGGRLVYRRTIEEQQVMALACALFALDSMHATAVACMPDGFFDRRFSRAARACRCARAIAWSYVR